MLKAPIMWRKQLMLSEDIPPGAVAHLLHVKVLLLFLLLQAELDKAIDFLDPIDTDVPKGGMLQDHLPFFVNSFPIP